MTATLMARHPWRRLASLALIALATLLVVGLATEVVARALFAQSTTSTMKCLVANDPTTGVHAIPGTSCTAKIFESPLVEYRFNECGFRTHAPCGAKADGTFRIVLIGSSSVLGMHVAEEKSFAALLPAALSKRLGRKVEIFNEGMQWGLPSSLALRTGDMLKVHPDMILWAPTPLDITNAAAILPYIAGVTQGVSRVPPPGSAPPPADVAPVSPDDGWVARHGGALGVVRTGWTRLIAALDDTRTVFMLKHLLYRSDSQYLEHALAGSSSQIDYLRTAPPANFAQSLRFFAEDLDVVVAAGRRARVPVVVTLLPSRAQYIMTANGSWPNGFDPRALSREIRAITEKSGATYIESMDGLHPRTSSDGLFYAVDEHMNDRGHIWMTGLLTDVLTRQPTFDRAVSSGDGR